MSMPDDELERPRARLRKSTSRSFPYYCNFSSDPRQAVSGTRDPARQMKTRKMGVRRARGRLAGVA